MAITLNKAAVDFAKKLIKYHEVDSMATNWKEHAPTPTERDHYIDSHTMEEYGLWFLGRDSQFPAEAKEHYVLPHGDLNLVHVCALKLAEQEARAKKLAEIERAAQELLKLIEETGE